MVLSPNPFNNAAMEISSSKLPQCNPRGLIRQRRRCAGVPASKRGNQANGTPSVRPSVNSTHMLSGSKLTDFTLAEVVMPCPHDAFFILHDDVK